MENKQDVIIIYILWLILSNVLQEKSPLKTDPSLGYTFEDFEREYGQRVGVFDIYEVMVPKSALTAPPASYRELYEFAFNGGGNVGVISGVVLNRLREILAEKAADINQKLAHQYYAYSVSWRPGAPRIGNAQTEKTPLEGVVVSKAG